MRINVTRSSMPPFEEYCAEIKDIWESRWLTNMGKKHNELKGELKKYLNVPFISLSTNGHLSLENILAAMQFPKGSEVITSPYTFASTTHAIARNGLIPVFCDINEDDFTIDTDRIENLITEKTVAIVPIHVYGNICNVEKLDKIAQKHNLKVIYDAAHAFGVKYKGVSSANFGDASMFSFHATKVFHTIEGGAVCYKNQKYEQILSDLRDFGIRNEEEIEYIGGNSKMTEFQAAMGICNLRYLDGEIQKRRKVVERYRENLSDISGIKLNVVQEDVESNYAYFPVVFDGFRYSRDQVQQRLKENNIGSRRYFYPITNSFKCYKDYFSTNPQETPIALYISQHVLSLPLFADLTFEEVDEICKIILNE